MICHRRAGVFMGETGLKSAALAQYRLLGNLVYIVGEISAVGSERTTLTLGKTRRKDLQRGLPVICPHPAT